MAPFSLTGVKAFFNDLLCYIFPILYVQRNGVVEVEHAKRVFASLFHGRVIPNLDLTLKSFIQPGNKGLRYQDLFAVMQFLENTTTESKNKTYLFSKGSSSSPSLNDDRHTSNTVDKDGDGRITEQKLNQAPDLSNLDLLDPEKEKPDLSRDGPSSSPSLNDDYRISRITELELNQAPDLSNMDLSDPNLSGKCFVRAHNMGLQFEEDQQLSKDLVTAQITEEKQGLSRGALSSSPNIKDDRRSSSTVDEDGVGRITVQELNQPPDLFLVDPNLSKTNLYHLDLSGKLCFVKTHNMDPKLEEDQLLGKNQVAAQLTEEKWGLSQDGLSSSPSLKDDRRSSNVVEKDGNGMFPVEHVKKALTCLYPGQDLPNLDITLKSFIKSGNTGLTLEDLVAVMRLLEETIVKSKKQAVPITEEERGLTTIPAKLASAATTIWAKLKCFATSTAAKLKCFATSTAAKLNWTAINQAATSIATSIATNCENWAKILGWVASHMAAVSTLVNGIKALTSARHMSALNVLKIVISICQAMTKLSKWAMGISETAGCWTMPIWKEKQY